MYLVDRCLFASCAVRGIDRYVSRYLGSCCAEKVFYLSCHAFRSVDQGLIEWAVENLTIVPMLKVADSLCFALPLPNESCTCSKVRQLPGF